jgi:hypothetical protein
MTLPTVLRAGPRCPDRRAEGDQIGYCGLLTGRCSFDEPEIGYELLRRAHGHGYATEAARAVMNAAFATGRQRLPPAGAGLVAALAPPNVLTGLRQTVRKKDVIAGRLADR